MEKVFEKKSPAKKKKTDYINPELLTADEKISVMLDSGNTEQKAKKYGLKTRFVRGITYRSPEAIAIVKLSIMSDCLSTAKEVAQYITPEKLEKSSAMQLSLIRRENVYTAQMLQQNTIGTGTTTQINILNVLTNRPDSIPNLTIPDLKIINKRLKNEPKQ